MVEFTEQNDIVKKPVFNLLIIRFVISFVLMIVSVGIIFIIVKAGTYIFLWGDDYVHSVQSSSCLPNFIKYDPIKKAINYINYSSATFGGVYFSMFLHSIFSLVPNADILETTKNVMFIFNTFYFISLYFICFSIVSNIILKKRKTLDKITLTNYLFSLIVIFVYGYYYYSEIFGWLSGAFSYSVPLTCVFISIGFLLYNREKENYVTMIAAIIFGVFGLGGNLGTGTFALSYITLYVINLAIKKKLNLTSKIIYLQYITAFIFNCIAPGNYKRMNNIYVFFDITIKIFDIFNTTNGYVTSRINVILGHTNLILALAVLTLIITIIYFRNISFDNLIITFYLIFLPYISALPVAVGYGKDLDITNRIFFLIDLPIILCMINLFIVIYLLLYKVVIKINIPNSYKYGIVVSIVLIVVIVSGIKTDYSKIATVEMINDLNANKYNKTYEQYKRMIGELLANYDSDKSVVIHIPKFNETPKHLFTRVVPYQFDWGINEFYKIVEVNYIESDNQNY